METNLNNYITVEKAGELLGLSRQSVYRIAKRCQWGTIKAGHARLYLRADVEATPDGDARHAIKGAVIPLNGEAAPLPAGPTTASGPQAKRKAPRHSKRKPKGKGK